MKLKTLFIAGLSGLMLAQATSCRKSESLDVDMSKYLADLPEKTELDNWITQNLTNPYNIELVYRFDRNLTDQGKDIAPIKLEKVKPTAEAILNIFLKAYEKVAGAAFIKTYSPKQFVLYGSPSYNSNGSITLGTADGGRRVVLYELNDLDFSNAAQVSRKMRTIHHEFTHILNQMIAIPPEFRQVSKGDYDEDWTNANNTEALARSMGFVSRYARSQYTEDFAEVTAHLLIEGQHWYDAWAKAAGADGGAKLKRKEALVVDYFKQYFNIDFRSLQHEVARVLETVYNADKSFIEYLKKGQILQPLIVDFANGLHYDEYGKSAKFDEVWNDVMTSFGASGRVPLYFRIEFKSSNVMTLQFVYNSTTSSGLEAWYDFNMNINSDGDVTLTYFDDGNTATAYSNGRNSAVKTGATPLINYFNENVFNLSWMNYQGTTNTYNKFAGFSVKDEPDNYFYGKY